MPNGGVLRIYGSSLADGQVRISVIDQGSGIPSEILEQIGKPFFTTKENGTGLGMLVSQQIIKEHRGDIYIESDSKRNLHSGEITFIITRMKLHLLIFFI
ncbi:hypothetical protein GCM10020331_013790 [Ectobacillus funiculus]